VQAARQEPLDSLASGCQPSWLAQQTLFYVFAEQYYSYSNQHGQLFAQIFLFSIITYSNNYLSITSYVLTYYFTYLLNVVMYIAQARISAGTPTDGIPTHLLVL